MITAPKVEHRSEQHYLAIYTKVNRKDIPLVLPPLISEVVGWLVKNNVPANGTPFFQYLSMNSANEMEVKVGVIIQNPIRGDGRISLGSFTPGHYAMITYFGDYQNMMEGHTALENWMKKNSLKEKCQVSANETKWGSRTEFYITDPAKEPDHNKWQTDIAFLMEE